MLNWSDFERAITRALDPVFPDCEAASRLLELASQETHIPGHIDMAFLFEELAHCHASNEHWQEAIAAMERAREFGWDGLPDARVFIAGYQLRAGNVDEARRLYNEARMLTPGDIWLYNAAGTDYSMVGDYAEALDWLTEGMRLALRTGDPEDVVPQLSEMRRECLAALGKDLDELERKVDDFLSARFFEALNAPLTSGNGRHTDSSSHHGDNVRSITTAVAWFPEEEYYRAVERWPASVGAWRELTHQEYSQSVELELRERQRTTPIVQVAPIRVDAYLEWCATERMTPSDPDSLQAYAMVLARRGEAIAWPPARNDACWCGSGRKYKKCCGRA